MTFSRRSSRGCRRGCRCRCRCPCRRRGMPATTHTHTHTRARYCYYCYYTTNDGWRYGVAVVSCVAWMSYVLSPLLLVGWPAGQLSSGRYITSICSHAYSRTQPCIPAESLYRIPMIGGNITSAGWKVTPCDPVCHVTSCRSEACCELLYSVSLGLQ